MVLVLNFVSLYYAMLSVYHYATPCYATILHHAILIGISTRFANAADLGGGVGGLFFFISVLAYFQPGFNLVSTRVDARFFGFSVRNYDFYLLKLV